MGNLLNVLKDETNYKLTENGGITHKTSKSYVLDYFAQGSALRNRSEESIMDLFYNAFEENPLLTMKVLFNSRDIRNGQGERQTFRTIIENLAFSYTEIMRKNLESISVFGRWDDLLSLLDTPLEKDVFELIAKQLNKDLERDNPSLCAKWLPSENASSKQTKYYAHKLIKGLKLTPKQYKKILVSLRKKIKIVETNITQRNYKEIDYSKLPSGASLLYRNCFMENDKERYKEFINKVREGKTTINVGTLYPYDLVAKVPYENYCENLNISEEERKTLDTMWNSLPNYIEENKYDNSLAVVDTSGSMYGTPMNIAISLGMYLAERNKGFFANHFITFESNPHLIEIKGRDFVDKVRNIKKAKWGGSTNIEKTFDLILNSAVKNNLNQDDLPSRIIIISDMEYDICENGCWWEEEKPKTNFDIIKEKFEKAGYIMPKLVFWNADSRDNNIPMTMEDNVQLVSGASARLFEQVVKDTSAYDLMLEVLNNKIYDCITV